MEVAWIDTPEEWRDFFLMCFLVAGLFAFFAIFVVTVVLGWASTSTVLRGRRMLKENVATTLDSVRETSERVRGTVGFIGDNLVTPVVKVYGTVAGVRRFVSVLSRIIGSER